jgi:hypothetical protein
MISLERIHSQTNIDWDNVCFELYDYVLVNVYCHELEQFIAIIFITF